MVVVLEITINNRLFRWPQVLQPIRILWVPLLPIRILCQNPPPRSPIRIWHLKRSSSRQPITAQQRHQFPRPISSRVVSWQPISNSCCQDFLIPTQQRNNNHSNNNNYHHHHNKSTNPSPQDKCIDNNSNSNIINVSNNNNISISSNNNNIILCIRYQSCNNNRNSRLLHNPRLYFKYKR